MADVCVPKCSYDITRFEDTTHEPLSSLDDYSRSDSGGFLPPLLLPGARLL